MTVKRYCDLMAWQKAMDLVEKVYNVTKGFPKDELYGLTQQVRRAAISIPYNIAEGQSRGSRDFLRFLSIAQGSLSEAETQMELAVRLGYVKRSNAEDFFHGAAEVGRLIKQSKNMSSHNADKKLATDHRPLATES